MAYSVLKKGPNVLILFLSFSKDAVYISCGRDVSREYIKRINLHKRNVCSFKQQIATLFKIIRYYFVMEYLEYNENNPSQKRTRGDDTEFMTLNLNEAEDIYKSPSKTKSKKTKSKKTFSLPIMSRSIANRVTTKKRPFTI